MFSILSAFQHAFISLFIFLLLQNKNTFENQDEKLESEEDFQSIRKKRVKPIVFDSDDEWKASNMY